MPINFKKGTSLIETMVALMILAAISTAIISLTLQILAINYSAKLKNQATNYVEKNLETVRNFYQNSGGYPALYDKASNAGTYYSPLDTTLNTNSASNDISDCTTGILISSPFRGYIKITRAATDLIQVDSVILWSDRGNCRNTTSTTYFSSY